MRLIIIFLIFATGTVLSRYHEKTRFDRSSGTDQLTAELWEALTRKQWTLTDQEKGFTVYKDRIENACYLEKLKGSDSNGRDSIDPKTLYAQADALTKLQAWTLAGNSIVNFCRGRTFFLLQEIRPTPSSDVNALMNEIFDDDLGTKDSIETSPDGRFARVRSRRQAPAYRGRFRGQTQSQYLNFGNGEEKEGKAEAESTDQSSHAIVSGNRGMGQAQSMSSSGTGCEDCPGYQGHGQYPERYVQPHPATISQPVGYPPRYGPGARHPGEIITTGGGGTYPGGVTPGTTIPSGGGTGGIMYPTGVIPGTGEYPIGTVHRPFTIGVSQWPGQTIPGGISVTGGAGKVPTGPGYPVPGPGVTGGGVITPGIGIPSGNVPYPGPGQVISPGIGLPGGTISYPGPGQVTSPGIGLPGTTISYPRPGPGGPGTTPGIGTTGGRVGYPGPTGVIYPGTGVYPGTITAGGTGTVSITGGGIQPGGTITTTGGEGRPGGIIPGGSGGVITTGGGYPSGVGPGGGAGTTSGRVIYPGGVTYPGGVVPGGGTVTTGGGGVTYPGGVVPGGGTVTTGGGVTYPGGVVPGGGTVTTGGGGVTYPSGPITTGGVTYPGGGTGGGIITYPGGSGGGTGVIYPGGGVSGTVTTGGGVSYPGGVVPGGGGAGTVTTGGGVSYPGGISYPGGVAPGGGGAGTVTTGGGVTYPGGGGGTVTTGGGVSYPGGIPYPGGGGAGTVTTGGGVTYPGGGGGGTITTGGGVSYPGGIVPGGGGAGTVSTGGGVSYPGGIVPGGGAGTGVTYPGGVVPGSGGGTGVTYPGGVVPGGSGGGSGVTYPGGVWPPGTVGGPGYPGVIYPGGQYPGDIGQLQQYPKPGGTSDDDTADSQASSSVKQNDSGTHASANAQGKYGQGTAQSQVSGTYTGSGGFSAQAGTSDGTKSAQTQVTGGKEGAMSNAQGVGGHGKSQVQVQLNSETGATSTGAQSSGWNHGTNSQVQASSKGGMADAQANGEGSTSSQAQIGFQPYLKNEEKVDSRGRPFRGGGEASAQSGTYRGQSQSHLQGSFQYGITYTGAAQAGSGSGAAASRKPFNFSGTDTNLFKPFKSYDAPAISQDHDIEVANPTQNYDQNDRHGLRTSSSSRRAVVANSPGSQANETTEKPVTVGPQRTDDQAYDMNNNDEYDEEYEDEDYDTIASQRTPVKFESGASGRDETNVSDGQSQTIKLATGGHYQARVTQNSNSPRVGDVMQPGESLPGYTIPPGFRGRVTSVSGQKNVAQGEGASQSQTVSLVPKEPNVTTENRITASHTKSLHSSHERPGNSHFSASKNQRSSSNSRSQQSTSSYPRSPVNGSNKPEYYTVTNSVAGHLDGSRNAPRKYEHRYYTKSSTCGYFTFSCNVVYGSNGRTKICKPKLPTYPDGTPMQC